MIKSLCAIFLIIVASGIAYLLGAIVGLPGHMFFILGIFVTSFLIFVFDYLIFVGCVNMSKNNAMKIAAIMAIITNPYILILITEITTLASPTYGNPLLVASQEIKIATDGLSTLFQRKVTFKSGTILTSEAIVKAAEVGLEPEQICLSLGDFSDVGSSVWEGGVENGHENYIKYQGEHPKEVKISVVCHVGKGLENLIITYYNKPSKSGLDPNWVRNCSCADANRVCCLIALKNAK